MFETSQDLFYVVLSFCVLWFTLFLCWALYYFIRMLKQMSDLMVDVREKIERVTGFMNFFKSKVVAAGVAGLMKLVMGTKQKKASKKTKKK